MNTTITPNDFGEPASVETTWNGSSVSGSLSFHYVHDRAGRIVARTEVEGASSTTLEYGYDPQGRLENVWRRTSPTTRERLYHYQYDANGNRIGWDLPTGSCDATVSTCVLVDEQDRLLSAGGVSYRYDLQGQLATRTEGTREETFTYDMAGNLRDFVVEVGGTQSRRVQYAIDALGRRVGRYVGTSGATSADRFWVYQDGLNPVAQLDASGNIELLFLYGTQAHVPDLVVEVRGAGAADDLVYRVVTDQVGSVRRLVNVETGTVAASFDYSPFGVVEREDGALAARFPFRFAGGLWDGDTGLVRFGARDYDPRVGRWTAKDPILWGGGQGNLYEYCGADPIDLVDPNGARAGVVRAAYTVWKRFIVGGRLGTSAAMRRLFGHQGDVFVEGGLSEAKTFARKYSHEYGGGGRIDGPECHPDVPNQATLERGPYGNRHVHALDAQGRRLPGHIFYGVVPVFDATSLFGEIIGEMFDVDGDGSVAGWEAADVALNPGFVPIFGPEPTCENGGLLCA